MLSGQVLGDVGPVQGCFGHTFLGRGSVSDPKLDDGSGEGQVGFYVVLCGSVSTNFIKGFSTFFNFRSPAYFLN